jgi:DNA polymerase-1
MHSFVASKIFPEIGDLPLKEIKKSHKDKRQVAKGAGFAINYGGNGYTISQNLGVTPEEGDQVYEAYFKAFPGLNNYFDSVKSKSLESGYIEFNKITGRKLFFDDGWYKDGKQKFDSQYWEIYRYNKQNQTSLFRDILGPEVRNYFRTKSAIERKALNYPIQGSSADITKTAGVLFFEWLEEQRLLFRVLIPNFVHDEIVCEAPIRMAEEVAQKLKECMEKAGSYFCKTIPLKAEPCIDTQWTH